MEYIGWGWGPLTAMMDWLVAEIDLISRVRTHSEGCDNGVGWGGEGHQL